MIARPQAPRLMLVTDARRARLPLLDLTAEAATGGVDAIYLRDIAVPPEGLAALVSEIRERVGDGVTLLVNGGPEAAAAAGTGLHLRQRDMTVAAARVALGAEVLIGRAVHTLEGASAAAGADYVLAGHVYPSASKPGRPPLGLAGLAAIAGAAPCPTLAIGGITAERVAEVVRAGAHGVAVIGAIAEADDPRSAAAALRAALDRARPEQEYEEKPPMTHDANAGSAPPTVEIVVNGETVGIPAQVTVHDFLASKRMTDAMAIVERNGEIVPRGDYAVTALQGGDRLEVVHAVGGGSTRVMG